MAQMRYPDQYADAKRRRVASRLIRTNANTGLTKTQYKAVQAIAKKSAKRQIWQDSDKKTTQDYSGINTITRAGTLSSIFPNLIHGDSSLDEMSGQKIIPSQVTMNWLVDFTPCVSETGVSFTSARVMIVQDKGAPFTANDVQQYMRLDLSTATAQLALPNWAQIENWKCLWDSGPMSFCTETGFVAGENATIRTGIVNIDKRFLSQVFVQEGDEGQQVAVLRNDIRVLWFGDSGASPSPILQYQVGCNFTDGA